MSERSVSIRFGGLIFRTPPVPLYVISIARQDYRERRKHDPRHVARNGSMAFLLSAVCEQVRPTAKHKAWQESICAKAAAGGEL